jgi:UDP-N-acetylmuramoyl-tripeptide--D-alanyl-D-alanine ligase
MIPLSVREIASIVGGAVAGEPSTVITAPAAMNSDLVEPGGLFVAFVGERADGHDFVARAAESGAVAVLGTRPTSLPTVVVHDVERALQMLAEVVVSRLRDQLSVAAVTGSQGKTSTKDLLAAILGHAGSTTATLENLNNELGVPLTMLRVDRNTRYLVLEMGARHLGELTMLTGLVAPDVAIVTNVGRAHIGKFGSQAAIAKAKGELVAGLAQGGIAVLNADDHRVLAMRALTDGEVLTFGTSADASVRVDALTIDRLGRPSFELHAGAETVPLTLQQLGAHQAINAAAAAAAALAMGIPLETAAEALAHARLSKWRMQPVDLPNGALLINDTYNSSPGSARASLDALATIGAPRRIAVLGEILELGDESPAEHRALGRYAASRADIVVAVGMETEPLASAAEGLLLLDNRAATDWLRDNLRAGDVLLIKGSRGAHMDEIAAALEQLGSP